MLFDYYGFPAHTYELSYPAPGEPKVAAEVARLLEAAGLPAGENDKRGFDHGVFVPMMIVDPKAEIPVVMVSIERDLDPARHIAIGKALAPLRDQGDRHRRQRHELSRPRAASGTATTAARPRSTPGSTKP